LDDLADTSPMAALTGEQTRRLRELALDTLQKPSSGSTGNRAGDKLKGHVGPASAGDGSSPSPQVAKTSTDGTTGR
jgi:hypothetical protein